jgi:hypothetical protein
LPEAYALEWFWLMARYWPDRLGLLLLMTHVVIERPADWDFAAVRRDHENGITEPPGVRISRELCFACYSGSFLYLHHIIEVQNGGSNWHRNKVAVCFGCHKYLHPWLTAEPPRRRTGGFQSAAEIGPDHLRDGHREGDR